MIFINLFLFSCSKNNKVTELTYTLEEFNRLAEACTSSHNKDDAVLIFSDYKLGVNQIESKRLVFKDLIFFAVSFENESQAKEEAIRLNQYYARNWLFDRVEREPVLEDYVIETFKAKNPNRKIQRIPKHPVEVHEHEATSGEAVHGEAVHGEAVHGEAVHGEAVHGEPTHDKAVHH